MKRFSILRYLWLTSIVLGVSGCAHWVYPVTERSTEVFHIETSDGWSIAIHHYAPRGSTKQSTPVLLCHGISSNKYNWDLNDEYSFPDYIASKGFDTYVVELRGSGQSTKPGLFDEKEYDYSFDDYVLRDLPAAINFVSSRSETGQVHWMGHSMGSMVMYAYLQRVGQEKIRSVTAVGSPPKLFEGNESLGRSIGLFPVVDWFYDELPSGLLVKTVAPLAYPGVIAPQHVLWNYDNLDPAVARQTGAHAVDNLSSKVVRQLVKGAADGYLSSEDGHHNYTDGMKKIEVPIFFVVGGLDQMAPPAVMVEAFRKVQSKDKRIEILSRANGYAHDYGHVDLVLGKTAPREVFPLLEQWLMQHEG
ncbi:MAG: alpha/beta fold hydrolase [Deltaproteobacteria bacterium]|nr:alpha/beta fold hydrolase [Deltaproteobacteria bacterium]